MAYQRKPKTATIYRIYDRITNESYIGSTRGSVTARWADHLKRLRNSAHNAAFQAWWDEYGVTRIAFGIVEENVSVGKQMEREQFWFERHPCTFNGTSKIFKMVKRTEKIEEALELLSTGYSIREVARQIGMSHGWVQNISQQYELVD